LWKNGKRNQIVERRQKDPTGGLNKTNRKTGREKSEVTLPLDWEIKEV